MASLSRETVIQAYRLMLGREPESEEVIQVHRRAGSIDKLREGFLDSEEFRGVSYRGIPARAEFPPMQIDCDFDAGQLRRLFAHVRKSWESLGQNRPYYSVLTSDQFLPEQFGENETRFWATGEDDLLLIEGAFQRHAENLECVKTVLEFGCGVGRVTAHLSRRFQSVFAADLSETHLKLAMSKVGDGGAGNVKFIKSEFETLDELPNADLVYCRLVLQHNPPPLMLFLIKSLLSKVREGGYAIFQLPVYMRGYVFDLSEYFKHGAPGMEMHCLPQSVVFRELDLQQFSVIEVREWDDVGRHGDWVSNTFFAKRRQGHHTKSIP